MEWLVVHIVTLNVDHYLDLTRGESPECTLWSSKDKTGNDRDRQHVWRDKCSLPLVFIHTVHLKEWYSPQIQLPHRSERKSWLNLKRHRCPNSCLHMWWMEMTYEREESVCILRCISTAAKCDPSIKSTNTCSFNSWIISSFGPSGVWAKRVKLLLQGERKNLLYFFLIHHAEWRGKLPAPIKRAHLLIWPRSSMVEQSTPEARSVRHRKVACSIHVGVTFHWTFFSFFVLHAMRLTFFLIHWRFTSFQFVNKPCLFYDY